MYLPKWNERERGREEREASTHIEWIYHIAKYTWILFIIDARPCIYRGKTSVGDSDGKVGAATKFDLMEFEILSELTLAHFRLYFCMVRLPMDAP